MRSWIAALAVMPALTHSVRAETMLDTVLYVVSLMYAHDNEVQSVTVQQDADAIDANFRAKAVPVDIPISIRRLDHCRFRVDKRNPLFPENYTVDFATAAFHDAAVARVRNVFGRQMSAIVIPATRYCFVAGNPYLNAGVAPGACIDHFAVDYGRSPEPMFAALDRLRRLCTAPSS